MFKRNIIAILFVFAMAGSSFCTEGAVATAEPAPGDRSLMKEMYRVLIVNMAGGDIRVSEDKGTSWQTIGHVAIPATKVSDQGYTASKWVNDGDVAAVAVNSIHVKTDFNQKDDKGVIFSIVPKETLKPDAGSTPEASIFTDIKAGEGIFGGGYSPFVGSRVMILGSFGQYEDIPTGYVPKLNEVFFIKVERPARYPKEIIFDNRFGGLIRVQFLDGERSYIGQVLRPIEGVGRFLGTEYADVGRIRANHAGVICISTSPLGRVGGFQIIPAGHGMSSEMITARTLTQWMVIGPVSALDPSFEGVAPFFKYFLQPRYTEDDIEKPDWQKRLRERFLVEVKYKGSDKWKPMPAYHMDLDKPLPKWASTAMEGITQIRIMFPVYREVK